MAFSPFNVFRRNQKAIFAVVTVFIMFTFVLSSGLGGGADFFDWFPKQFRAGGDSYCTIDGDTINEREVREARFQRVMANRFMVLAAQQTSAVLRRDAQEKLINATPTIGNPARDMIEGRGNQLWPVIAQMAQSPNANPNDRALVMVVEAWMVVERHKAIAEQTGGTYFLNAPNKTARDVIDFMLWERKADKFGITFTDGDVKKLVRQEFFDQFRNDVDIREYMTREYSGRFTPNALSKALAAEFRVRAAQTALLGPVSESTERTATAAPIFTTPFDLFSYYKDKSSPVEYRGLAVPAASFATLITETPSDREVKRLYDERKDYEPDPQKEEFGFKEPRKVKIEWVSVTGEEPYYKKAAADWITRTEQFAKGGVSSLVVPTPGVGPAAWASAATAPMVLTDPLVNAMYQAKVVMGHKGALGVKWGEVDRVPPSYLLDTSYQMWTRRAERTKDDTDKKRPAYAAGPELAALLTGLGTASINGSPVLQPAAFHAQAVAHELRARGTSGGLLLLSTVPGPGLLPRLAGAEAGYRQSVPPPPTVESVRAELLTDLSTFKARELALNDLKKLQEELVKLGNNGRPKDKGAAARAFAAEFIKERGLKTGSTPEGVSTWTVRDDPALAPLRDSQKTPEVPGGMAMPFGQRFFSSIDPKRGVQVPTSGDYLPEFYPERLDRKILETKEPVFMAWRTDDQPARTVPFDDPRTKARVVEAWKRAKGREEARRVAEEVAARIRAVPGTSPAQSVPVMIDVQGELQKKFADPRAKDAVKLLRLDNVAPIQVLNDLNGMARPFTLAGIADLPFPTADMAKQLVDHRADPPKTVLVLPDAGKDTFYVFVLTGRQERGIEEFRQHLYSQMGRGPVHNLVLAGHARDAVTRARDTVMTLLRRELKYAETDQQKERLDARDKKGEE